MSVGGPAVARTVAIGAALALAGCAVPSGRTADAPPGGFPEARARGGAGGAGDADGDGVADAADACPDSRTRIGIDARGCSVLDGPLPGVTFRPGRAELGSVARAALDPVVAALRASPDAIVGLEGHTDNRGNAARNLELSKRRVMSVVGYLVTQGVAPERLRPAGFGEGRPVAPNATAAGREANRRIEVHVLEPGAPRRNADGA